MVKLKGLLFDLDGTVIDTSAVDSLRESRKWKECVSKFPSTHAYKGIHELFSTLGSKGISLGIVTSSVSYYASKLLNYHGLKYDILIAYHDVANHKPHPEPYVKAVNALKLDPINVLGIGDKLEDYHSLSKANIRAIGAAWNSRLESPDTWDNLCMSPIDLLDFFSGAP